MKTGSQASFLILNRVEIRGWIRIALPVQDINIRIAKVVDALTDEFHCKLSFSTLTDYIKIL